MVRPRKKLKGKHRSQPISLRECMSKKNRYKDSVLHGMILMTVVCLKDGEQLDGMECIAHYFEFWYGDSKKVLPVMLNHVNNIMRGRRVRNVY
jgi:hypothetical protein